jgi:hypothetical protein
MKDQSSQAKVICVIGMGRSGTSLVAKLLQSLGVYFGSSEKLRGYEPTEHIGFQRINAQILRQWGGRYHNPPPKILRSGWERSSSLHGLKEEATHLVQQEFSGRALWGWKDPSTTLTLPFWQSLLGSMHYILCVRNPLEVVRSYQRFRNFPPAQLMNLWLLYNALALEYTHDSPRLVVFYEDLLDNPDAEMSVFTDFLGINGDTGTLAAIQPLIKGNLRHQRSTAEELLSNSWVPSQAKTLYLLLKLLAWGERSGDKAADGINLGDLHELTWAFAREIRREAYQRLGSFRHRLVRSGGKLLGAVLPSSMRRKLARIRDLMLWT